MNPWYELLVRDCYDEHDETCEAGAFCESRDDHVLHVYVPFSLRDRVESAESRIQAVLNAHVDDGEGKCIGCYAACPGYAEEFPDHPCAVRRALTTPAA